MSALEAQIEKSSLPKYGNNVEKMMDDMHATYNTIIEHDWKHEDFVHHTFQALLSSANHVFHNFHSNV